MDKGEYGLDGKISKCVNLQCEFLEIYNPGDYIEIQKPFEGLCKDTKQILEYLDEFPLCEISICRCTVFEIYKELECLKKLNPHPNKKNPLIRHLRFCPIFKWKNYEVSNIMTSQIS